MEELRRRQSVQKHIFASPANDACDWVAQDAPEFDDVLTRIQRESADPLPIAWHTGPSDVRWQNDAQSHKAHTADDDDALY